MNYKRYTPISFKKLSPSPWRHLELLGDALLGTRRSSRQTVHGVARARPGPTQGTQNNDHDNRVHGSLATHQVGSGNGSGGSSGGMRVFHGPAMLSPGLPSVKLNSMTIHFTNPDA